MAVRYVSTVRCASIFAKKYSTLVRIHVFVVVRVYGTLVRYLNMCTKRTQRTVPIGMVRIMCNLQPSMKIRATVNTQLKLLILVINDKIVRVLKWT